LARKRGVSRQLAAKIVKDSNGLLDFPTSEWLALAEKMGNRNIGQATEIYSDAERQRMWNQLNSAGIVTAKYGKHPMPVKAPLDQIQAIASPVSAPIHAASSYPHASPAVADRLAKALAGTGYGPGRPFPMAAVDKALADSGLSIEQRIAKKAELFRMRLIAA
jgi:hypothetical protein